MASDSIGTGNESNAIAGRSDWRQVAHDGKQTRGMVMLVLRTNAGEKT